MSRISLVEMAYTMVEIDLVGHRSFFDMKYINSMIRMVFALAEENIVQDMELLELGAIFHDCDAGIDSEQSYIRDGIRNGLTKDDVRRFLKSHKYPTEKIGKILDIISQCSSKNILRTPFRNTFMEKAIIYLSAVTIIKGDKEKKQEIAIKSGP